MAVYRRYNPKQAAQGKGDAKFKAGTANHQAGRGTSHREAEHRNGGNQRCNKGAMAQHLLQFVEKR